MPDTLKTETGHDRREPPRRWRNGSVLIDDTDRPKPYHPRSREREVQILTNLWKIDAIRSGQAR